MEAKNANIQLEIAAHWLEEAGRHFSELKQYDFAQNCKRVAKSCLSVAKREAGK